MSEGRHAHEASPPFPPASAGRRICRSAALHRGPPDLAFSGRQLLPHAMEWSGSLSHSPCKGASLYASTGSSARLRRRFAGMDSSGRPPGSALAQRLCGLPMAFIECDDCPRQVLRLTSGTPTHPG
ncbi:Type I inositol-1,4,5-trisphosphate 5-phosphatase CVP2 [Hordeum vulgare]|nr:Type I inositol-1,4,5-trisphosphate 5-phosphatase CVP2 [Hordeum vulgare]